MLYDVGATQPQSTMATMPGWHLASNVAVACAKEETVDDKRFDTITRALATTSLRRGVVKSAAGGALGLVGLSALREVAAQGVTAQVGCNNNDDCGDRRVCNNRNICVRCVHNSDCKKGKKCNKKKDKCVKR